MFCVRREFALSRKLLIILSVWVFGWGMAAVDLSDLSDELVPLSMQLSQVVESELDEIGNGVCAALMVLTALTLIGGLSRSHCVWEGVSVPRSFSTRPLYQQLTRYQI